MTCRARETKGKDLKGCNFIKVGEDTGGDVMWCQDCGVLVSIGEPLIMEIPQFVNWRFYQRNIQDVLVVWKLKILNRLKILFSFVFMIREVAIPK